MTLNIQKYVLICIFFNGIQVNIIKSVILKGLLFGFLTGIYLTPAYLLIVNLQLRKYEKKKKLIVVSGAMMGQLLLQISIYYRPLVLVLSNLLYGLLFPICLALFLFSDSLDSLGPNKKKPPFEIIHTIEILHIPIPISLSLYELAESIFRYKLVLSMLVWNSIFIQIFDNYFYPNSTLFRLLNVYLFTFKSNNKIWFLVSSFFGWLMGHLLVVKYVGDGIVWKSNVTFTELAKNLVCNIRNLAIDLAIDIWADYELGLNLILTIIRSLLVLIEEEVSFQLIEPLAARLAPIIRSLSILLRLLRLEAAKKAKTFFYESYLYELYEILLYCWEKVVVPSDQFSPNQFDSILLILLLLLVIYRVW